MRHTKLIYRISMLLGLICLVIGGFYRLIGTDDSYGYQRGQGPDWGSIKVDACTQTAPRAYHCRGFYRSHCCDIQLQNATIEMTRSYSTGSIIDPVHNDSGKETSDGKAVSMSTPAQYYTWWPEWNWLVWVTGGAVLLATAMVFRFSKTGK